MSDAPPEAVFDLLADGANWASWAGPMVPASSWAEGAAAEALAGSGPVGGVGAIRKLGRGIVTREEIIESDRPRRHSYRVVSGLPVRDYVATVDVTPQPHGGTKIVWSGSLVPKVPGTGRLLRFGVVRVVRSLARHLATAASGRPAAS